MAKLTKSTVFAAQDNKPETPMEKTTRIVRTMVASEAEQREAKNARLRKARLEREASTPKETNPAARKTGASKAAAKR